MNILVTTDGSERSYDVLPHVERFASQLGGSVTLLRILNPLIDVGGEVDVDLEAACSRVARAWEGEMAAVLRRYGIVGETLVVLLQRGEDVHEAVLRVGGAREAALIAMHSRGSGALRHALLGSVAMGVLGHSTTPLLLIGANAAQPASAPGYHIVATSDGSPASTAVLKALGPLVAGTLARVSLLRIVELRSGRASPEVEIQAATAQLESLKALLPEGVAGEVCCRTCKHDEEVAGAIVAAARELKADAIALSTHGESALHHLLAGSVALSVLERAPLPVILSRAMEPS